MRVFFLLALVGLMIGTAAPAAAQYAWDDSAAYGRPGYYWDGYRWNPLQGRAPWREPLAYTSPYAYDGLVYGAPVPRRIARYRWRTTVPRRYTTDLNLGGYPAGAPSYQYKYYNP